MELIVEIGIGSVGHVGVQFVMGPSGSVRVGYDSNRDELYLDRAAAMAAPFARGFDVRHTAPLRLDDAILRLHVFIDASSVEVFAGDGEVVMTDLVFPDSGERGIEIDATGRRLAQVDLSVWSLRSIW